MSLLTAVITATIFAAFGFPYRYYQCWYSWGGFSTHLAVLVYFGLAGCGGGFLGWMLAQLTHAEPTGILAVDGVIFGAGGALTLRADFRPRRIPASRLAHPVDAGDAASMLSIGLRWTGSALDDISRRRIDAWFTGLSDDDLVAGAYQTYTLIKLDGDTPARTKNQMAELLVDAMEQVRSRQRDDRLEGRARLITFSSEYYLREHLPRPLTVTRSARRENRSAG